MGLPPPDTRSLRPLSSAEFVDHPPEQNSRVRHSIQVRCWMTAEIKMRRRYMNE